MQNHPAHTHKKKNQKNTQGEPKTDDTFMLFSQLLKAVICHKYWKNSPPIASACTKVKNKIKAFSETNLN